MPGLEAEAESPACPRGSILWHSSVFPTYGHSTDDIIEKLKSYDSDFGIDIYKANDDTIEFWLKSMPKNMVGFVKDLKEFCPGFMSQGPETIEGQVDEIKKFNRVWLWWD